MICSSCSCWSPVDKEECYLESHKISSSVMPDPLTLKQTGVLPTLDVFRPEFTAGTRRVSAKASGADQKRAISNAICKFLLAYDCDQIVGARVVSKKTVHPRFFFFDYPTYTAEVTGFPVTMSGLVKEKLSEEVAEKKDMEREEKNNSKDEGPTIMNFFSFSSNKAPAAPAAPAPEAASASAPAPAPAPAAAQPECKPAMIELTDINLSVTAKAQTSDKIAVKLPACPKK